jgi:prophage antirepressor-like protein
MANTLSLVFESTTFEVITRDDQPWLRLPQIGVALGYARGHKIQQVFERNKAEFTDNMTAVVKLPTAGGEQDTRIFSLRGAHLLAMFARTAIAALFRKWVLDILDAQTAPRPMLVSAPYAVLPGQTLTAEQADTLRSLLTDFAGSMPLDLRGLILREGWSKLKSHFKTDYRHIQQAQFNEAISIVSRHIANWAPSDPKKKEITAVDDNPTFSFLQKRWLVYFDHNGVECAKPIPLEAVVMTFDELVQSIEEPGGWMLSNAELARLAASSTKRLAERLGSQTGPKGAKPNLQVGA